MTFAVLYPWIKSLHIIFVIYWMAGMLMLPRYFAYHAECEPGSDEDRAWQSRELKLMRIIINPAMTLTWIFGLTLAWKLGAFTQGWLQLKLLLVIGLSALHGQLSVWRRAFTHGNNTRSSKFYRMMNEIPSLSIIAIVILVVVKPF